MRSTSPVVAWLLACSLLVHPGCSGDSNEPGEGPGTGRAHASIADGIEAPRFGWVSDHAGLLSAEERRHLALRLGEYEVRSGNKFAVLTLASTGAETIEDYALRLARAWRIDKEKLDNSLLVVIAGEGREAHIECGAGLATRMVPDSAARAVLDDHLLPEFAKGRWYEGLSSGIERLMGMAARDPAQDMDACVFGRVVDGETDQPLSGVICTVRFTGPKGSGGTTCVSDVEGMFAALPPTDSSIWVVEASFIAPDRQLGAYVSAHAVQLPHALGVVPLRPLRTLTLRAIDEDGSPVPPEVVTLDPFEVQSPPERPTTLEGVVPGSNRVLVTAKGYRPQTIDLEDEDGAVVRLSRATGIEVFVVDWRSRDDVVVTLDAAAWPFQSAPQPRGRPGRFHPQFERRGHGEYGDQPRFRSSKRTYGVEGSTDALRVSLKPARYTGRVWFEDLKADLPIRVFVASQEAPDVPLHRPQTITLDESEWRVVEVHVD